jgi:ubiquinone/menaquinone biosynthesis C-methylase UbiE
MAEREVAVTQNDLMWGQTDEDRVMIGQMEKVVDTYDSLMRKMTLGRERALREMTVNLAQVKPGDCVLEVGCGTGTLALAAKRQAGPSGKVFGIDVIPGMIEHSQQKAAQADLDVTFQLGTVYGIPFPANQFDVVMGSFMIFHMSETVRRKGITEIYRVLKPQGTLLVLDAAEPTQPLARAIARALFRGVPAPDLHELLPLMEATGFSDIEFARAPFRVLGLALLGYVRGTARKS